MTDLRDMTIINYLEYAKRKKIKNRLTRALSQRIYLIEANYEFTLGELKVETKPDSSGRYIYHDKNCSTDKECNIMKKSIDTFIKLNAHNCVKNHIEWKLLVQGSSNSQYFVSSQMNKLKCNCIDFNRNRGALCKHIQYVYFKVLGYSVNIDRNYDSFIADDALKIDIYYKLCEHFFNMKATRIKEKKKVVDENKAKKDELCCICYDIFGDEDLSECANQCNGIFHTECINMWKNRSSKCPLCRQHLITKGVVLAEYHTHTDGDQSQNDENDNDNNTDSNLMVNKSNDQDYDSNEQIEQTEHFINHIINEDVRLADEDYIINDDGANIINESEQKDKYEQCSPDIKTRSKSNEKDRNYNKNKNISDEINVKVTKNRLYKSKDKNDKKLNNSCLNDESSSKFLIENQNDIKGKNYQLRSKNNYDNIKRKR